MGTRKLKPAAQAYAKSVWYIKTLGDRYVGACPVCNAGKDRFKVHFRGEYQDRFFCEQCAPPGDRNSRNWRRRVLEKLGLWEHRPQPSRRADKQKKETQRIADNRRKYQDVLKKRNQEQQEERGRPEQQGRPEKPERREGRVHPIHKVLALQPREHPIGCVEADDHPGLHFPEHQLHRHPPVTSTDHRFSTVPGDWVSWGEVYQHTPLFRGWLTLKCFYPTTDMDQDDRSTLLYLSVLADTYPPGSQESFKQIPDVWLCGICPVCKSESLFIGALSDQMWASKCSVDGGCCVNSKEGVEQVKKKIEESALYRYITLTRL